MLGVCGNILILLAVFGRGSKDKKSSMNIFLSSLAMADLLFCIVCIPAKVGEHEELQFEENSKPNKNSSSDIFWLVLYSTIVVVISCFVFCADRFQCTIIRIQTYTTEFHIKHVNYFLEILSISGGKVSHHALRTLYEPETFIHSVHK